jgi:hypothetical protein
MLEGELFELTRLRQASGAGRAQGRRAPVFIARGLDAARQEARVRSGLGVPSVASAPAVEADRMTSSPQQLRNSRATYDRLYRGGYNRVGKGGRPVIIPEDVEVFEGDGSSCFMCGTARGLCRHRRDA